MPTDSTRDVPAKLLRPHILHHLSLIRSRVHKSHNAAHARYKNYFGKSLWSLTTSTPSEYVYVDRRSSPKTNKEKDRDTKLNILPTTLGLFQIIAVVMHTVAIYEDKVPNVLIDRVFSFLSPSGTNENEETPTEHNEMN